MYLDTPAPHRSNQPAARTWLGPIFLISYPYLRHDRGFVLYSNDYMIEQYVKCKMVLGVATRRVTATCLSVKAQLQVEP